MGLAERLSQGQGSGAPAQAAAPGSSLIGVAVRRRKDLLGENARRLQIKVHNRLFETIDVSKLETLEPAMVSVKVTAAINDILNEDEYETDDIARIAQPVPR